MPTRSGWRTASGSGWSSDRAGVVRGALVLLASLGLLALPGLPGATVEEAVLRLGDEEIALVRFDPLGAPYPLDSRSNDLCFQHLAIVMDDMAAAWRQLAAQSPRLVSTNGPDGHLMLLTGGR